MESRRLLATLYWDPDRIAANNVVATGAGLGGSGTWTEGGAAVWFDPGMNAGAGGYVAWASGRGDTAVFAGASGGAVTIAGTVGAAGVDFRGIGYVVGGGGFATAAGGTIFTATVAAAFNAAISGGGALTKAGAGTLTLGAACHSYTGDTILTAGVLNVLGTIDSHVKKRGGDIQGVLFYDPQMAAAVREALAVDAAAVLTPTLLAQASPLTSLTLDGNRVSDLTGVASLTALQSLSLIPGDMALVADGLASLQPLAGLGTLVSLAVQHVGLTDAVLGTLPSLPGLTALDVRFNGLSAVPAAVAGQPRLSSLLVHGNGPLTDAPRTGLAALRGRPIDVDVAPDRPEAAVSVVDLAARLYHLPLKMLEYVSNTIIFQPYAGAMKGPLATLQTKAGNDWDTNALLAGLYAAAGIATRYVSGAIEITTDQLKAYVGARDVAAAGAILAQAGLRIDQSPNHLRHTWIEAFVTVPGAGLPAWVPLDASWKFREYRPGLPGMLATVPFSPLESDYLTKPEWRKKSAAEYYEAKVAGWLAANRPDLTTADVAYDGPVLQQSFFAVPATLPYAVLSVATDRPATVPAAAGYKVRIALSSGSTPLFGASGVELTLADVALSRLTIDPVLDAAAAARPVLRRDGQAIATASVAVAAAAQAPLTLTITVTAPAGGLSFARSFSRMADRFIAIGLDANQFSESLLVEKRAVVNAEQLNQANAATVDRDRAVGGLLDLAIASYFAATDADEASVAGLTSAVPDRSLVALGIATSGPLLSTVPKAGLQFPYLPADVGIDVPANSWGALAIDGEAASLAASRDVLLGCSDSSLEGLVIEGLTNFESVSTMKAFQLAAAAGGLGELVEINAGNAFLVSSLLPGVRSEIRQAIASTVTGGIAGVAEYAGVGFTALVPRNEIVVGTGTADLQWKGVGYTLKAVTADPARAALNGRTVGYIIHGAVGSQPVRSYGGAASRSAVAALVCKPTALVNNADNYQGDPVNIANGNVYHEESEVEIPTAGMPLAFRRRYDSVHTVSGLAGSPAAWSDRGMGEGWSFTYGDRLEIGGDGVVTWFTEDGMRLEFRPWHPPLVVTIAGSYVLPDGVFGGLAGSPSTGFTWTDFDGAITTFGPAVNGSCPLATVRDRFGNGVKVDLVPGTARLSRVSDLRDATRWLSFTYNADTPAHIVGVTDFTGRTWSYGYVGGRLATATAPAPAAGTAPPVVRYSYHADKARQGLLAGVTDPLGNVTAWEYYASRRGFRVTDAEGNRHSFAYNLHRSQSAFIDERGNASLSSYDDAGNLLERRQPDRTVERSTWSSKGLRLSATDAYGATETYVHDAYGKLTSFTDRLGSTTTYAYRAGSFRGVETIVAVNAPADPADDVVTRFAYDAAGFLISRIDDAGTGRLNLETRFAADAGGRGFIASSTSPLGCVTSFTYGPSGQVLTRTADAAPGVTMTERFAYDQRGNLISKTDGNGNVTTFGYDALGRKTVETPPDPDGAGPLPAPSISYRYDAAGNQIMTVLHNGRTTRFAFDRMQRVIKTARPDGTYSLASYDAAGNAVTQTDAAGRSTRSVFDARNRQVAVVLPDGTTQRKRLDGGGRMAAVTDAAGATTTFAYDKLGRTIAETAPALLAGAAGPVTRYVYDSSGNLAHVTDSLGDSAGDPAHSTSYEYDPLGRRIRQAQADPDGPGPLARPVTSFGFDKGGNLVSVTDPRGFTTTFGYDQLGRRIVTTGPDPDGSGPLPAPSTRSVYDKAGNLRFEVGPGGVSEQDVAFTTEHVYDALNREVRTILPDPDGPAGPQARPVSSRGYDVHGQFSVEIDARGMATRFSRDSLGRTIAVTNPAGGVTTTVYDAVGNAVITGDPLGRRTVTTFDRLDRPVAVRSPRPSATSATPVTTFRYDVVGNLVATNDPLGRTAWRQYDALGRLVGQTDALGIAAGDPSHTTRMEYDAADRVTAVIDPLGRRTDTVYDNLGRKIRVLAADAGQGRPTTHYGYDAAGNLRFVTDPRGAVAGDPGFTTWMFYDGLGRRTAIVDPLGQDWPVAALPETLPAGATNVTVSTYDAFGRLSAVTDPLGRRTDHGYDNLGRKIAETLPAPDATVTRPVTRYAYDAVGNVTAVTDPLGFVTAYAFDALGRRTVVTDPRGFATTTAFDACGNTLSVTDASGNVTRYAYDRLDRPVAETDPLGATTSYAYDLAGNKVRETDRNGRVTAFAYDAAGRLVEERWQSSASAAVGHTIRRYLDAVGQIVGIVETDAANPAAATRWQFDYDAGGNMVRSRMAPGEMLQMPALSAVPNPPGSLAAGDPALDWDGDGKAERYDGYQISLAVGEQLVVSATSAAIDPVLLVQRPGGGLATALLDEDGFGGTGAWLRIVADVAGTWLIAVSSRDENAVGGYDLAIVKDANPFVPQALVEYDLAYDKAGNLSSAVEDQAAVASVGSFGKAASGLGVRTAYVSDAVGRATRVEQSLPSGAVSRRVDTAYRGDGSVASVARFAGAGVNPVAATVNQYDGLGRLVRIVHSPAACPAVAYGYTFDAASRITSLTSPEGASSFAVDAADQLLSASLTGEAYAYDRTGNRSAAGVVVGPGNRLLSDGTFRYDYDREGNRTAKYRDADRSGTLSAGDTDVSVYGWDQRNRLVAVSHVGTWTAAAAVVGGPPVAAALPGSDLELRYTYDAFDRRIRRAIDADGVGAAAGWDVSFAGYQGDLRTLEIHQDAMVWDASGRVVGMLGSVVQRTLYGGRVDEVLAVEQVTAGGTATWWTLGDHQGSIRDVVSGVGATFGRIVEHRQYDGFGKLLRRVASAEPGAASTAGVGVEFGYAGRPLEVRTGLSDNRARWYEPATGRFVSEDPSGFKGGDANLFRYAGNDPLNRTDPSGLAAKWAQQAGRSAVPAAGFAGLTGPALTRSGVGSVKVKASTPSPTLSLASRTTEGSSVATMRPNRSFGGLVLSTGHGAIYPAASPASANRPSTAEVLGTRGREAARYAYRVYDKTFDDNSPHRGGLLTQLNVKYAPRDGFQAAVFQGVDGDYYLAFRGTEGIFNRLDMLANKQQGFGDRTSQYEQAVDLALRVNAAISQIGGKLIITGHSLGAGLAAAAAHATGRDAELFNPAWITCPYAEGRPGSIRSHVVRGEPLDRLRRWLGAEAPGQLIYHDPAPGDWSRHGMRTFLEVAR